MLEGRWSRGAWPGDTASSRDFTAGEERGVEARLPNTGVRFINIQLNGLSVAGDLSQQLITEGAKGFAAP